MKTQINFSFTLFNCNITNNIFAVGKNSHYQKYFLQLKTDSLDSEYIKIDKNIFDAFFLCENLEILNNFSKNLIVNKNI